MHVTCSDVPESFVSSPDSQALQVKVEAESSNILFESSHNLVESSRVTRTVESLQVIGLQDYVESNEI